jgi:hypothetical protein
MKFSIVIASLVSIYLLNTAGAQTPVEKYLTEKKWNQFFPNRHALKREPGDTKSIKNGKEFYSFASFVKAAKSFPLFLSGTDSNTQKRELAAFLANIAYETGAGWDDAPGGYYAWGLYYVEELGCEKGCPSYSDSTKKLYPVQKGKSYHGRGPLQLSWNYNYGQFSKAFFNDTMKLLRQPELVSTDPVVSFASSIWFWTTPQYPKPSCHQVMSGEWMPSAKDSAAGRLPGFGTVLNVINGGIDCGPKAPEDIRYRYGYYRWFCRLLQVDPGKNISCAEQKPFGF